MGRRSKWTPELAAQAVQLGREERAGPAEIGRRLGVSASAVGNLFARLRAAGVAAPPKREGPQQPPPRSASGQWATDSVRRDRVFELAGRGATFVAIAAELQTTVGAIAGLLSRARERGENRAFIADVRALVAAEAAGVPPPPTLAERLPPCPQGCRWIFGHPGEPGWHWCDAAPFPGRPYCPAHAALAYRRDAGGAP